MIDRHSKCVFIADSPALAEVIVMLLKGHDIVAQMIDPAKIGLTVNGIEIWVEEPANAERARELIPQLIENMREMLFEKPSQDQLASDEAARRREEIRKFKARRAAAQNEPG